MSQKSKMSISKNFSVKNEIENKLENPQKLPLDKLYLKVYNKYGARDIKAIDPFWVGDYSYPKYYSTPNEMNVKDIQKWLFKNNSYFEALKLFYNLPYQEFWSHVVYEPAFSIILESFLERAVPPYMLQPEHEDIVHLYSDIYSLVFAVYKRFMTFQESETEYMCPEIVGAFLYDNSVIKIETILTLIRIYGYNDDGPLAELIETAFKIIPQLTEQLKICSNHFYDVFESVSQEAYHYENASTEATTQMTLLLYDVTFCIHMFMKIYPPLKNLCLETGLLSKIIYSYEEEVPLVSELVKMVILEEFSMSRQYVNNTKIEMLEICNMMLNTCFDLLLESQDIKWVRMYLESIEEMSKNKKFAANYNAKYSLHSQLEMLGMIFPDYMASYDGYDDLLFIFGPNTEDDSDEAGPSNYKEVEQLESEESESSSDDSPSSKKNIILDSKIQEVLEVLPYYGDGFIEKCLRYYGMKSERVIEAILSVEGLPPELAKLDIDLPRIPPETDPNAVKPVMEYKGKKPDKHKDFNDLLNDKSHLVGQKDRYQQYQSEEWYDSLYNDDYESDEDDYGVPLYEGGDILDSLPKKKGSEPAETGDDEGASGSKPTTSRNRRDDRHQSSWINAQPQRENRRRVQNNKENIEDQNKNKDSSSSVPNGRNDRRYQKKQWNNTNNPNRTNPVHPNGYPSEEESEEDSEGNEAAAGRPRNAFCEDPAVVRARREAAYGNRQGFRKSRDVVGKPKGQGQEKDVQINRDKKSKNKSSSANHNRRSGAQWKRTRGMIPS